MAGKNKSPTSVLKNFNFELLSQEYVINREKSIDVFLKKII